VPRPGYWPASVHMCGYWWSDRCTVAEDLQLPPAVLQLIGSGRELASGTEHSAADAAAEGPAAAAGALGAPSSPAAAPVCVDFGSMPLMGLLPHPHLLAAVLLGVARRLRRPVLVLTAGWQPLVQACRQLQPQLSQQPQQQQQQPKAQQQQQPDPPWLVPLEVPVSHDWLLPRCAALLHHGGAGTVAAALRCGTPQLVCPLHFDQQQWAERVVWLGCGARLEPAALLQAEQQGSTGTDIPALDAQQQQRVDHAGKELAAAIAGLLEDAEVRQQCARMRQQLASEDGLAAAVGLIRHHLDSLREEGRPQTALQQAQVQQQAQRQPPPPPPPQAHSNQQQSEHQPPAAASLAKLDMPGGLRVRCLPGSEGEVLFIHRELFTEDCYLPQGMSLLLQLLSAGMRHGHAAV